MQANGKSPVTSEHAKWKIPLILSTSRPKSSPADGKEIKTYTDNYEYIAATVPKRRLYNSKHANTTLHKL